MWGREVVEGNEREEVRGFSDVKRLGREGSG